ncbi:MAG TPA: proline--tRNA ligase [Acidimicrobiales bacterium]|jgi:prolyl-tRNA synthetase|nr:proline--tRNA ligase [Acidimicrobiales bacterium]
MRMSRLLLRTLRDAPSDAEAVSHQLLVRAGYIRRVASGVYTFLPLGWRVLRNVERIVREEMDGAGAQEILMPIIQPSELWAQTGRLHTMQDILFTLEGKGGDFVLAPTHEELVTATVAAEVDSYRDLPLNVYQIQFKYRDEARPRFGLLRGREFIMKDAYSFDASQDGMRASYQLMYDAYCRVFDRLGLTYTPVEADAGAIGGDVNHEFMVPSSIGEDHFARCTKGDYAANTDAATTGERSLPEPPDEALEEHHTPDRPGIEMVVEFFADRGLTAAGMLKCLAVADADGNPVVVLVPGDRDVRVPAGMRPFEEADFERHPELVKGYIGPMGLREKGVRVLADHAVRPGGPWVTGANRPDHHVTGATLGRDFTVADWGSYATVADGDPCPRCGAPLELVQSVEAGHTFQLGLTYSAKIPGATFTDEAGAEHPYWMGCYGIGISRAPAVVAEEHHDEAGLVWPAEVAPYRVHLLSLGAGRSPEVAEAADRLYGELTAAGVAVLYDDRDASPGVKFADADLLGMPTQLIVGAKGLDRGVVERKDRRTGERDELPADGIAAAFAT